MAVVERPYDHQHRRDEQSEDLVAPELPSLLGAPNVLLYLLLMRFDPAGDHLLLEDSGQYRILPAAPV